uniref:Uncharacterized protein n=1 Tax=Oryza sativa subsp. japonica TaxID=39947 RepID=Q5VN02_ORYSJ|nr:hypothetical protein [Oryza sativa Japonica Group]
MAHGGWTPCGRDLRNGLHEVSGSSMAVGLFGIDAAVGRVEEDETETELAKDRYTKESDPEEEMAVARVGCGCVF